MKKPDFSHRINHRKDEPLRHWDIFEAIEDAATQSDAIISLVQSWHVADAEDAVDQINPQILFYALESVSKSIADMRALARALRDDLGKGGSHE